MTTPYRLIGKRLGELLLERKVITEEQLKIALGVQEEKGGLLGQVLMNLGYATEEAVAQALTTQYGFPYLPLKHYQIDGELIQLIPENVARQYCLIPVDRIGDALTVAMADPLHAKAVEDIEMLTQCAVSVFVATMSDVIEAIEENYKVRHA